MLGKSVMMTFKNDNEEENMNCPKIIYSNNNKEIQLWKVERQIMITNSLGVKLQSCKVE